MKYGRKPIRKEKDKVIWPNENGSVAELAYAADSKSVKICGFDSHQSYQNKVWPRGGMQTRQT